MCPRDDSGTRSLTKEGGLLDVEHLETRSARTFSGEPRYISSASVARNAFRNRIGSKGKALDDWQRNYGIDDSEEVVTIQLSDYSQVKSQKSKESKVLEAAEADQTGRVAERLRSRKKVLSKTFSQ